jgi:hypothetical protein
MPVLEVEIVQDDAVAVDATLAGRIAEAAGEVFGRPADADVGAFASAAGEVSTRRTGAGRRRG